MNRWVLVYVPNDYLANPPAAVGPFDSHAEAGEFAQANPPDEDSIPFVCFLFDPAVWEETQ